MPDKGQFFVSGIPISMDDTDWYLDYCSYAQPVNSKTIPYGENCRLKGSILFHAYMHKVILMNPRNEKRKLFKGSITFALTGGRRIDYNFLNQTEDYFLIQNSPKGLMQDTGIKYIGIPASYDKKNIR